MTKRKKYTKEFKQDAVRLVTEQGYNQSEAARNLGSDRGMLGRWVKEFQEDESEAFRGNGKLTTEQEELRRQERDPDPEREEKLGWVKDLAETSDHTYGSRRMAKALQALGYGGTGRYQARSLMREAGVWVR